MTLGMGTRFAKFKGLGLKPIYAAGAMFVWLVVGGYYVTKVVVATAALRGIPVPVDALLVIEKRLKSAQRKFKRVEEESGFAPEEFVITSYSIHYTKLYDTPFGPLPRLQAGG